MIDGMDRVDTGLMPDERPVAVIDLVVGMTAAFLGTIAVLAVLGRVLGPDMMSAFQFLIRIT